jgi:hypothetical protein
MRTDGQKDRHEGNRSVSLFMRMAQKLLLSTKYSAVLKISNKKCKLQENNVLSSNVLPDQQFKIGNSML